MEYIKEHFKGIDKSKRILEAGSIDSWNVALDGSQSEAFDYIVASNLIEYVPDLIKFFADVQNILAESGKLFLTISNKIKTADRYRQPTTFAEIYDIHKRNVRNNPVRTLDCLLNSNQNGTLPFNTEAFDLAIQIYERIQNTDVQTGVSLNVFTPESFLLIIYSMLRLRMIPFKVLFFIAPPEALDFDIVLEKNESILEKEGANANAEYILKILFPPKQPNIRAENIENSSLGSNILKISHSDFQFPFYVRNNTSDVAVYHGVMVNCEYAFIKEKDVKVIVDAGANIGFASIYFAKLFPNAKIIAIEPEETNFALLEENTKNYPNVIRLNRALWNEDGEINLIDTGLDNWGFMTLDSQNCANITTPKLQKRHVVKTVTIESILKDYGFPAIDLLKIDIEGAEKEVLNSCQHWIGNVNSLIIELHERMKSGCEEAFNNMKNNFKYISQHGEDFYLRKKSE